MFYCTRKLLSTPFVCITFQFLPIALAFDITTLPFQALLLGNELAMKTDDLKIIDSYIENGCEHLILTHKSSNTSDRSAVRNLRILHGFELYGHKSITVENARGTSNRYTLFNSDNGNDHYIEKPLEARQYTPE